MTSAILHGHLSTAAWRERTGLRPRGTLFVITGRGEPTEVYARFGERLAFDAYRVVAISADQPLTPADRAAIVAIINDDDVVEPVVLVGSDTGAVAAIALAADPELHPAALVVTGHPVSGAGRGDDWRAEVEARTACPVHRQVLEQHARPAGAVNLESVAADQTRSPAVRSLAIHGSADTLAPLDSAIERYRAAGIDRVVVVEGGRHDILNDLSHRCVAATIVQFLEQLRLGGGQPDILRTLDLSQP
jgi:alpha-beta hydrolase superfamily lysophospholipase